MTYLQDTKCLVVGSNSEDGVTSYLDIFTLLSDKTVMDLSWQKQYSFHGHITCLTSVIFFDDTVFVVVGIDSQILFLELNIEEGEILTKKY